MTTKCYRKFTKKERRAVKAAIKEFTILGGRSREDLAEHLNANKIVHPNQPVWTIKEVGSFLANNGLNLKARRSRTAPVEDTVTITRKKDDRLEVMGLLLASELPDNVKMKALTALLG